MESDDEGEILTIRIKNKFNINTLLIKILFLLILILSIILFIYNL